MHFSTIYDACDKTLMSISEMVRLTCESILLGYPVEDEEMVRRLKKRVAEVRMDGDR